MPLKYVKEASNMGISRFAAIRESDPYEINVAYHSSGIVGRINLQARPVVDNREECTEAEFVEAYQKALERFGMFLLSLSSVQ